MRRLRGREWLRRALAMGRLGEHGKGEKTNPILCKFNIYYGLAALYAAAAGDSGWECGGIRGLKICRDWIFCKVL
jgi:hypothetical protein